MPQWKNITSIFESFVILIWNNLNFNLTELLVHTKQFVVLELVVVSGDMTIHYYSWEE